MSSENLSELGEQQQPHTERRRSTTVIMTANVVTMPAEPSGEICGVRRTGSMRRRLSKQNATVEEPISLLSMAEALPKDTETVVPCIEEHPEEDREEDPTKDDGHTLRPPVKKSWTTSKSLSRESTGTEYSDRSGTDLRGFLERTLHKSDEDRKQLLEIEKELKSLVLDETTQSRKFELPSSYHRMMVHRCAAWFGLDHNVTNKQTDIVVNKSERTKLPEENFVDFIRHDNFTEGRHKRHNTGGFSRKELQHIESFGEQQSPFGSQASLSHELLMMRRAQSFDVAGSPVVQTQTVRGLPMRQLSLNCPQQQQPLVGAPMSSSPHHGHQWAPQRSFDVSNSSYLCTGKHSMMRKAESFGGMANGHGCYEPLVCQTPPSVMVHHHHHHAAPQATYTQYQVFDEIAMPSPNFQPEPGMCSPGGTFYEYVPQSYSARPVRYVTRPASTQYLYGGAPFVQYQHALVHPEVEVIVDPVQAQPFPPVTHFVVPAEQQGYSSSHQAATATSFIKASIDGGYGSMNQEQDSGSGGEKNDESASQQH